MLWNTILKYNNNLRKTSYDDVTHYSLEHRNFQKNKKKTTLEKPFVFLYSGTHKTT